LEQLQLLVLLLVTSGHPLVQASVQGATRAIFRTRTAAMP
jgi:hypothetical protein